MYTLFIFTLWNATAIPNPQVTEGIFIKEKKVHIINVIRTNSYNYQIEIVKPIFRNTCAQS